MLITNLPIEVQSRIFAEIYWGERRLSTEADLSILMAEPDDPPLIFDENDTEWNEMWHGDLRLVENPFPNNIASVCRLWRSIMSGTSRFWSRVILHLDDPACLPLDVFNWSRSRILDVVIKSRPKGTSEDAKKREHVRVMAAFNALAPHIPSCKSIIFDVKHASSLPSPTPFLIDENSHLKTLKLESQINDMVSPSSFNIPSEVAFAQTFCHFQNLSLHGSMFMELSQADPNWLEHLSTVNEYTTLTISHLECSAEDETPYTVAQLVEYLSSVPTSLSALIFKHVRFVGQYGLEDIPVSEIFESEGFLTFEDVDSSFIHEFMPALGDNFLESVTFKNCRISHISECHALSLYLIDIPDDTSLANLLELHNGTYVTFTSCRGFNDYLLNSLATNLDVPELRDLYIYDCDNFTIAGLRAFLKARLDGTPDFSHLPAAIFRSERAVGAITHLEVRSKWLRLTDKDKIWFKEYFGDEGHISWEERRGSFIHSPFQRHVDNIPP